MRLKTGLERSLVVLVPGTLNFCVWDCFNWTACFKPWNMWKVVPLSLTWSSGDPLPQVSNALTISSCHESCWTCSDGDSKRSEWSPCPLFLGEWAEIRMSVHKYVMTRSTMVLNRDLWCWRFGHLQLRMQLCHSGLKRHKLVVVILGRHQSVLTGCAPSWALQAQIGPGGCCKLYRETSP